MISKRKIAKTAATFGVAMAAMYTAPELQAQVLDITWEDGNPTASNPFPGTAPVVFGIDQFQSLYGTSPVDFSQWNDSIGRTMNIGFERNIMSATIVALGQTLDPSTFTGAGSGFDPDGSIGGNDNMPGVFDGTGSALIGFRSNGDNVGWFRLEYTENGPIIYSEGEYGSGGETLMAGGGGGGGDFVTPDSFTTFRGVEISATLTDFAMSDDTSASYNPGFVINDTEAPVWLVFDGVAPAASSFRVESTAGTPGLTYTVEAFNWNTEAFEVIDTQDEAFNSDQVVEFPIVAADHINSDGEVRSRVGWRQTGFTINFPWQVNVDQVGWNQ